MCNSIMPLYIDYIMDLCCVCVPFLFWLCFGVSVCSLLCGVMDWVGVGWDSHLSTPQDPTTPPQDQDHTRPRPRPRKSWIGWWVYYKIKSHAGWGHPHPITGLGVKPFSFTRPGYFVYYMGFGQEGAKAIRNWIAFTCPLCSVMFRRGLPVTIGIEDYALFIAGSSILVCTFPECRGREQELTFICRVPYVCVGKLDWCNLHSDFYVVPGNTRRDILSRLHPVWV